MNNDRLYNLLPEIHRQRDAVGGYPLQALLRIISEQVNVVEADIAQLYDNWFIETAQDWAVPYLGDLIGHELVHEAGSPGDVATAEGQQRNKILMPRREIANTIRARRRKGTLALLEELACDIAGWPGRAVEFYQLLAWTQHLNHLRLARGRTVDLRNGDALDRIDGRWGEVTETTLPDALSDLVYAIKQGAFDELAHTVDVRRINSRLEKGNFNISSVGLFLCRLPTYSVTKTSAYCLDNRPHCYRFSILGNDEPLYNLPQPETDPTHIAEEINLPTPIRRRAFAEKNEANQFQASSQFYGAGKSLVIYAQDWPKKGEGMPVAAAQIIPADLSNWHYRVPEKNYIAVDPELGRFIFPVRQLPKKEVRVSYRYAFSADIGGGEYDRPILHRPALPTKENDASKTELYRVGKNAKYPYHSITKALEQWAKDKPQDAIIEIADSRDYTEQLEINLGTKQRLQLRAANRCRPVLRILNVRTSLQDALIVTGKDGSHFTLDGLMIAGRGIQISAGEYTEHTNEGLAVVTIRHSTLVPGWDLEPDCQPAHPEEASVTISNTTARVNIEHSILGSIFISEDADKAEPVQLCITDSIIDSTSPKEDAIRTPEGCVAHAVLTIKRSTVMGDICVHAIHLAENCIFNGKVNVAHRQIGCVRFCYVPSDSRTPRRFNCQPDLVVKNALKADKEREAMRIQPRFNSTRYGRPDYCQLALTCAAEITRGADDESEMGAFHDLFQPQRTANLRARLDEFTPAGMEAGIIFVN